MASSPRDIPNARAQTKPNGNNPNLVPSTVASANMEHRPAKIAVIVVTLIIFIVTAVLNAYASEPESSSGIYTATMSNVSNEFMTGVTPARWTFGIWGVIYFWMAAWIIYCHAAIFIKWDGDYLYKHDVFAPSIFFILYSINLILNFTWLILFDRKQIVAALFVLLALAITAVACLCIAMYAFKKGMQNIAREEFKLHFWLIQLLMFNGIACYATWLTVATNLNLNIALTYAWGFNGDTVILIILLFIGAAIISADMIIFEKHTIYVITPYIVLVVALYGVVDEHVDIEDLSRIGIFMIVVLALFCGGLLYKIVSTIWNHFRCRRPAALI
ncbi:uncharacterized protein LOC115221323 isoform X3 [Octopus sinensis]|uniref:Uncharacterized protein LOC115221323 isoform X3 n=1 Tax=Octopus sinensis TaxID=2607531 RepID=A0A7E6FJA3_9MOLL|nr:uncharacterized protein LOC115221323 isoform X3 [Octopus sinensis]